MSVEPGKDGKLICEDIKDLTDITANMWLQFASESQYEELFPVISKIMDESDGRDVVKIYISDVKKVITLPSSKCVQADTSLIKQISEILGAENIKVTY